MHSKNKNCVNSSFAPESKKVMLKVLQHIVIITNDHVFIVLGLGTGPMDCKSSNQ